MNDSGNAGLPPGSIFDDEARLEPGGPSVDPSVDPGPKWHSRGYLPHLECAELIQHVTFHLADSLPKAVLERLDAAVQSLPLEMQDAGRRKRVQAWLDAGHGSCVLRDAGLAGMVQDSFLCFDGQRYRLLAWVVMPNHVHVLFQPMEGWTVAKIVASWKSWTGRRISQSMRTPGSAPGSAGLQPGSIIEDEARLDEARLEPGGPRVWHREYWDRYIRDENHLAQAVVYIHENPVKAGLVRSAEEWRWSSAYAGNVTLQGDSIHEEARLEPGGPRNPSNPR